MFGWFGPKKAPDPREAMVAEAFQFYLDTLLHELLERGYCEDESIELLFRAADSLFLRGVLPQFPDRDDYQMQGRWLVAAYDAGYADFVRGLADRIDARMEAEVDG